MPNKTDSKCLHCGNKEQSRFMAYQFYSDRANVIQCLHCGCLVEIQYPGDNYRTVISKEHYMIPELCDKL